MSTQQEASQQQAEVTVRNIGGIDETTVSFSPGVTILEGENATNRTSLLRGIMAALGSEDVSVKGDADEAYAELAIDGETYTRELTRQGTTIHTSGDPYLEDPTAADLFAFLLESNEARRAIESGQDLREVIMRPIDTDEIQAEIDRLVKQRREVEQELDELDALKDELPSLEERRTQLQAEIDEKKDELEATEAEVEERDVDLEQTREEKAELEESLSELRETRSELEDVRYDLETERDTIETTKSEQREVESELEALPEAPVGEIDEIEARIDTLRERKRTVESEITEIQNVIRFNQERLDESTEDVLMTYEDSDDDLTEELLPDDSVVCWTCGSEVPEEQIESTIENLQELNQDKLGEVRDIESELDELNDEVGDLREQQQRRERLQRRQTELADALEQSEETIERLTDRREELQADVESLETEIESLEDDSYEEVLDLHKEANQHEYDLGRLESDLEDVEAEISAIEDRLDEETGLQTELEAVTEELEELRGTVERIEIQAIEAFNDNMDAVLDILEYDNLERIWLERKETEVREGRKKVTKSVFDLHIVRQTDSAATYEDTIDHLSESEREVTGLVFAIAGYLVHEVYEEFPCLILDSLEAIDAGRIARLIEYIDETSEYLVVALLPEDAQALETDAEIIEDI